MSAEATQTIAVDYDLSHPPRKVWRALTEPKLLASWLMPNDINPAVGHRFTFKAPPMPGWDGTVQCEVLEADPPRRLSYSWRGGIDDSSGYGSRLDTVVTWTLTATATGTRLHLEHSGFLPKNAFAFENMGKGWRSMVLPRMDKLLAELGA